jgi:hypothetical protein
MLTFSDACRAIACRVLPTAAFGGSPKGHSHKTGHSKPDHRRV